MLASTTYSVISAYVEIQVDTVEVGSENGWGAGEALEHLLKSGAGTTFYDAIDPDRRESLTDDFLGLPAEGGRSPAGYQVSHDYVGYIAQKR